MLRRSVLLCSALGLAACDPAAPAAAPSSRTVAEAAPKNDTAGKGEDGDCEAFAELICEEAGAESSSCAAARETTTLMHADACAAALTNADHTRAVLAARATKCTELADKLCAEIGDDTQTCALLRSENGPKDPAGCEAMLADFDTVLSEVRAMEAKNQPLPADKVALISAPGAPGFGPPDAPVTIVEFSDFQCPYCSMAAAAVKRIEQDYPDKVRVIFRQFPLSFHTEAHLTAQASLAAHAQGKFWPFHDLVFANQRALQRTDLESYAKEAGLDLAAFNQALDAGTYKAQVDAELEMGGVVFVSGTPSMFLNGKPVANPTDYDALKTMIDAELGS